MKSLVLIILTFLTFASQSAFAEEYLCTYTWENKTKSHSLIIDVDKNIATIRGGVINQTFTVVSNSKHELLLYEEHTKEKSGMNYPVGFSLMAFDKKTRVFVRSNTFTGLDQNNHAFGECRKVISD